MSKIAGKTRANVSQYIAALLHTSRVSRVSRHWILAVGRGRDLRRFAALGRIAVGLEGAPHFAVMARAHSGCKVWQQDFIKLDLPNDHFDGVFAVPPSWLAGPRPSLASAIAQRFCAMCYGHLSTVRCIAAIRRQSVENQKPCGRPRTAAHDPKETFAFTRRMWSRLVCLTSVCCCE